MEFAVKMSCDSCASHIKDALNINGVNDVNVSLNDGTVLVQTTLPAAIIQEKIESTGMRAVLKGYGADNPRGPIQAAVAMLGGECGYGPDQVKGVIRFVQVDDDGCVVDGVVDGLSNGLHGLHIHEFGDISQGCESVGNHFSLQNAPHGARENDLFHRHTGDLGNINADENGRAQFRFLDKIIKVPDLIGLSLVVTENADDCGKGKDKQSSIDGNSGRRLACGIIARSAGLFENSKKICACDGVTLWDERDKPLTGPGRRNKL